MPPRRANRHQNVEALYRREEAELMEQRINEKFDEGIGKLEKLMNDLNRTQRRRSPNSNHGGNRVSPSVTEARRVSPQSFRERRETSISLRRDHHDYGHEERRTPREFEMSHIEMKRDIVEGTCVIEGMLMVEIDIDVHLISMKRVIELAFKIETKLEMYIGMLRMTDDWSRV